MAIGINPTVDFAFKLVFGSPDHTRITIHFLNSILDLPSPIKSVTIQNPFLEKDDDTDKLSILDILAVDQNGRMFNIEMQTTQPAGMNQRLLYHGARLYGDQLDEGEAYTTLCPAIVICVLTKPLFPAVDELHLDFRLRDASGRILADDLQVHLLQLSKLAVTAQNISGASAIDQWAYFMQYVGSLTVLDVQRLFIDQEFTEAAGVLEMISKTAEQRMQYNARRKFQMDEAARLELARDEGLQAGRLEGRQEALQEGLQKGELIGRVRVFQELLGVSLPSVDELSNYDEAQLSELANQLHRQLRSTQ